MIAIEETNSFNVYYIYLKNQILFLSDLFL